MGEEPFLKVRAYLFQSFYYEHGVFSTYIKCSGKWVAREKFRKMENERK